MIYLDACRGLNHIGRLGENEHRTLRFRESAEILAMYPDATVTVLHKRPGDPAAYPVAPGYVTIEGGTVCWTIQSGDLTTVGRGQAEVVFTSGGVIAKSLIYDTMIDKALDGAGDPPEPWESWIEDVSEEANRAENAAEDARGWANGTDKNGNPVPSTDEHYENNAHYWADQAQTIVSGAEGAIVAKGEEVLESIPADYTELSGDVDELKSAIKPLINTNNRFIDWDMKTMNAWPSGNFSGNIGWISTPAASVSSGTELTKAFSYALQSASTCYVGQDLLPQDIPAGDYVIGFRAKASSAITYRISITGYPGAPNTGGTSLVYSSAYSIEEGNDFKDYQQTITVGDTSSYNHIRVSIVFNSVTSASIAEILLLASGEIYSSVMDTVRGIKSDVEEITDTIDRNIIDITQKSSSAFIYKTGEVKSNSGYFYSNAVPVSKGDYVDFYGRGYLTNVAMISVCDQNTSNIVPKTISTDSTLKHYYYTVEADGYITVSGTKSAYSLTIYGKQSNVVLEKSLNTKMGFSFSSFSMFQTFGVIGDSYASGVIFPDASVNSYVTVYPLSWGQVLARNAGSECHNFSQDGLMAKTWLTNTAHGKAAMEAENALNLYIICLGINDYLKATYDLGTSSDIGTQADSFYGYYSQVISAVKTHAPNAAIICSTMRSGRTSGEASFTADQANAAIEAIAAHYGIPCIKPDDDPLFVSGYYKNNMSKGHPVAVMYSAMAEAYRRLIEAVMVDNFAYFHAYTGGVT